MKQSTWLARWFLLCGAGLLLARNQFFGLSPFALAYVTLLFYFVQDWMLGEKESLENLKKEEKKRKENRHFLGSYGTFLFCSVFMGIVMEFSVGTGIRYGISMFLSGMLVMGIRKKGKKLSTSGIALCAMAGGISGAGITQVLLWDWSKSGMRGLVLSLLEAVLSFFLVFLFDGGLRSFLYVPELDVKGTPYKPQASSKGRINYEELLSIMLLVSFVLMGCPGININGFDIVFFLRFFFILLTAYLYGAGAGALSGVIMGLLLAADAFMGNSAFMGSSGMLGQSGIGSEYNAAGEYGALGQYGIAGLFAGKNYNDEILLLCLCGVMAGMGREFSKLMAVLGFLVTGVAFYYLGGKSVMSPYGLLEICAAAVFFLLIPSRFLTADFSMEGRKGQYKDQNYRECFQGIIRDKMKGYSKAFLKLTKSFLNLSEERQEMGFTDAVALVDGVSQRICSNCSFFNDCVTRTQSGNLETSAGLLKAAMLEEEVSPEYLPKEFLDGCIHADDYLYALDKEIMLARMNLRWHNNMAKTREAIAVQMKEVSNIMDRLSKEAVGYEEISLFDVDRLRFLLRRQFIDLGQVVCLKNISGRREIHLFARARRGCLLTTKELADYISHQLKLSFKAVGSTKLIIDGSFEKITLREDTKYGMLMGIARCTKKEEEISGDSFSCMQLESGMGVLSISDGMGSGKEAFAESQAIMDLMEEMLEAGFGHETTIRLIHSILMEQPEKQSFSTLDLGVIDLYNADLEMMKIGGAPTFIKRGQKVETIQAGTLPMGILDQMELASVKRKLYDSDMIIMMSDGVLDGIARAFPLEEPAGKMAEEISKLGQKNPKDIVRILLKLAGGNEEPRDDMTILAASFYEKKTGSI